MPNIRVDLSIPIYDGQPVTFKSPADCSQVTGLIVYYPEGDTTTSKVFQFADAHRNNVGNLDLFAANAVVKVILDTDTNLAFVQNADTNAYLEGELAKKYSPDNKPTATDVGAVRTYTSLEELGLTQETVTINSILQAMGTRTAAVFGTTSSWSAIELPGTTRNGILEIDKYSAPRASLKFTTNSVSAPTVYLGSTNGGNTFNSWVQMADTNYAVNKAGDKLSGNLEIEKVDGGFLVRNLRDGSGALYSAHANRARMATHNVCGDYQNYRILDLMNSATQDIGAAMLLRDIVDGQVVATHTVLHTGNKNLIAPEDIGAARLYQSFIAIGLTEATATVESTVNALVNGDILLIACGTDAYNSGLVPEVNGLLLVWRRASTYTLWEYHKANYAWRGYFNSAATTKWSGWQKFATTDYAVNKAGDTMTGNLAVERSQPTFAMKDTTTGAMMWLNSVDNSAVLQAINIAGDSSNRRRLILQNSAKASDVASAIVLTDTVSGANKTYTVLHTGNYDNYAVPLDGSKAMTGALSIENNTNAQMLLKRGSVNPVRIQFRNNGGTLGFFGHGAHSYDGLVRWLNDGTTSYKILDTGNIADLGVVQVATGSYTGTGGRGQNNPNTLTFSVAPKVVAIHSTDHITWIFPGMTRAPVISGGSSQSITISWSNNNKTITWYSSNSDAWQLNVQGITYNYIVFY